MNFLDLPVDAELLALLRQLAGTLQQFVLLYVCPPAGGLEQVDGRHQEVGLRSPSRPLGLPVAGSGSGLTGLLFARDKRGCGRLLRCRPPLLDLGSLLSRGGFPLLAPLQSGLQPPFLPLFLLRLAPIPPAGLPHLDELQASFQPVQTDPEGEAGGDKKGGHENHEAYDTGAGPN